MPGDVRARMIESAVLLLAQRGLQATSFTEVLEASAAPRGSIYHHFPAGKDQLIGSALELAADRMHGLLDTWEGATAQEVTDAFLGVWRVILTRSQLRAGCAVLAVTVATDSPELLDRTAAVFRDWRTRLAQLLERGGLPAGVAAGFATTLVAASEGAVVMSRAEQSMEPFELVADELSARLRELSARP
jgi:TetR/AcrR family transcriptional repressor of lmrAB and yxaGH operons